MRLIVDADSMKPRVREIIARAAARYGLEALFVANRELPLPQEGRAKMVVARDADAWIAGAVAGDGAAEGRGEAVAPATADLVITRDIPLAARVVASGAEVITDHGEHLTTENMGKRRSDREFAMAMRARGDLPASGKGHGRREIQSFANELDRTLAARMREAERELGRFTSRHELWERSGKSHDTVDNGE